MVDCFGLYKSETAECRGRLDPSMSEANASMSHAAVCRFVGVFPSAHAVHQGVLVDFQSFDNVFVCRHIVGPEAGPERTHSLEFATSPPGMWGNVTHTAGNVSWKNHHPDRDYGEGGSLFFSAWPHQELFLVEVPVRRETACGVALAEG